jgi:hypothetical protein
VPARPLPATLGALGVGLALTLTGCTLPDVSMSPDLRAGTTTAPAAAPTSTPPAQRVAVAPVTTAVPTPTRAPRPSGDLDTGSITHSLPAGDRTVVVDYWTTQDATGWTGSSDKTVQVAVHLEGGRSRQDVEVTRFLATTDDGTSRTTVAEDRGEFVLTPPFSYTTALGLPPSSADASSLTLAVQVELLVETSPNSGQFFRSTVLDSLTLPLVQEDTK